MFNAALLTSDSQKEKRCWCWRAEPPESPREDEPLGRRSADWPSAVALKVRGIAACCTDSRDLRLGKSLVATDAAPEKSGPRALSHSLAALAAAAAKWPGDGRWQVGDAMTRLAGRSAATHKQLELNEGSTALNKLVGRLIGGAARVSQLKVSRSLAVLPLPAAAASSFDLLSTSRLMFVCLLSFTELIVANLLA